VRFVVMGVIAKANKVR